jgi:hypothetical protein
MSSSQEPGGGEGLSSVQIFALATLLRGIKTKRKRRDIRQTEGYNAYSTI